MKNRYEIEMIRFQYSEKDTIIIVFNVLRNFKDGVKFEKYDIVEYIMPFYKN